MLGLVRLLGSHSMYYLKPLRRNLGVATLVTGCVFAAGWVRTTTVSDQIVVLYGASSVLYLNSDNRTIGWEWRRLVINSDWFPIRTEWISATAENPSNSVDPFDGHTDWLIDIWGFYIGAGLDRQIIVEVPYWSIVIPLTLLSAWLLLSKPRAKKIDPSGPLHV